MRRRLHSNYAESHRCRLIMTKLICIQASPRQERSHSRAVANAFLKSYIDTNPDDTVETVDLYDLELPAFDGLAVQAKYTILQGKEHTEQELSAWTQVEQIIAEFKSADKYVIATPMWNFGIPYRLKHYIDLLVQPGYTFSYSPEEGYKGLLTGKPIVTIYARGGEYSSSSELGAMDFQKKYVDLILGFMGFTNIKSIILEPTLMAGPDVASKAKASAIQRAKEIAKNL